MRCVKANHIDTFYNTCLILDGCSKCGRSGLVSLTVRIRIAVRHLSAAALHSGKVVEKDFKTLLKLQLPL